MKQVLLNLLRNAAEATAQGGHVCISAGDRLISAQGKFVDLIVADTGPCHTGQGSPDFHIFIPRDTA